jgi:hypothetical protein
MTPIVEVGRRQDGRSADGRRVDEQQSEQPSFDRQRHVGVHRALPSSRTNEQRGSSDGGAPQGGRHVRISAAS